MAERDAMEKECRPHYLRLSCAVQNYAWGKVGLESEVARLMCGDPTFSLDKALPYSELWMGVHAKAPSVISHPPTLSGMLLSDWLRSNRWALGDEVAERFDGQLPFLFKVLSIGKSLSIQAHPTQPHAKELHARAPDKYPDPNHKPEMVIVVRDFEGFCGFRPLDEIQAFVSRVAELRDLIGAEVAERFASLGPQSTLDERRMGLKEVFSAVMGSDPATVRSKVENLVARARETKDGDEASLPSLEASLLFRLHHHFPGDVGCFCIFFLNFLSLQPGESLFLAPNEPHAYLSGDVIECMACSDNVVRAGLTQKFRDKDTLCEMLTYNMKASSDNKFQPQQHSSTPLVEIYDPPTPEFSIARIIVPAGEQEFFLSPVTGPSIFILFSGSMNLQCNGIKEEVKKGTVIFLPAGQGVLLHPNSAEDLLVFRAYCQL